MLKIERECFLCGRTIEVHSSDPECERLNFCCGDCMDDLIESATQTLSKDDLEHSYSLFNTLCGLSKEGRDKLKEYASELGHEAETVISYMLFIINDPKLLRQQKAIYERLIG